MGGDSPKCLKIFLTYGIMTDYTYWNYCEISIPYIKEKDRYVTCPRCRQDIYVGTEKTYKHGKKKRTHIT